MCVLILLLATWIREAATQKHSLSGPRRTAHWGWGPVQYHRWSRELGRATSSLMRRGHSHGGAALPPGKGKKVSLWLRTLNSHLYHYTFLVGCPWSLGQGNEFTVHTLHYLYLLPVIPVNSLFSFRRSILVTSRLRIKHFFFFSTNL